MGRKYDTALLDRLQENAEKVSVEGVTVLVKPIPEGGEPGDMDPRLYKSMKMLPLLGRLLPKPKKGADTLERIKPLRKMFNEYKGAYLVNEGVETRHITIPSTDSYQVPVRIYTRTNAGKNLPIFVYYHGGGFFGGSPDIVEQMCKLLVQTTDCVALSVDYRLCPEAHYPQPLDDCWCATRWAYDNAVMLGANPHKLAVGGDSAGGHMAAVITLRDREEQTGMVKLQVLLYPAVNISGKETEFYHGTDLSKYRKSPKHAKVLDAVLGMMSGMLGGGGNLLEEVYLQGHLPKEHIYASPLLDDFHGLPETLLAFREHDFLVFEDFAYARAAHKAGVPLETIIYQGIGHGFADQIGVQPQAEDIIREIARKLEELFH